MSRLGPEDRLHLSVAQPYVDLFWSKVDRSGGEGACWPWIASLADNRYGQCKWPVSGSRKKERAHRVAFLICNGWLPVGRRAGSLVVRHSCDNPKCCNPAHLLTGTQKQNVHDAIDRGRASKPPRHRGENHPRARLNYTIASEARAAHAEGVTCAELARRYEVGETTMGHLLAGRTWRGPK